MKTQLLKKLSLLLCVCLLLPLFGCANGNASTGQQAAEDKTIQPPFAGVKWGMTVEQVQAALGEKGTLTSVNDNTFAVTNYSQPIFGAAVGYSPAYLQKYSDNTATGTVFFEFTKATTYEGETVEPVLQKVSFTLSAENFDSIFSQVRDTYGVDPEQTTTDTVSSQAATVERTYYSVRGTKTMADFDDGTLSLLLALHAAGKTGAAVQPEQIQLEQAKQTIQDELTSPYAFCPTLYFALNRLEPQQGDAMDICVLFSYSANYCAYADMVQELMQ